MKTERRLESIEHLDFTPEIRCEALITRCRTVGDHPADWWYRSHCHGVKPICDGAVQAKIRDIAAGRTTGVCMACGARLPIAAYDLLGPVR